MENNEDIKILEELKKVEERISKNQVFAKEDRNTAIKRIKAIENLLSRLKTAERMNDVLAETLRYYNGMQQVQEFCIDICEDKLCDKENCKDCIKEWARNKAKESE